MPSAVVLAVLVTISGLIVACGDMVWGVKSYRPPTRPYTFVVGLKK